MRSRWVRCCAGCRRRRRSFDAKSRGDSTCATRRSWSLCSIGRSLGVPERCNCSTRFSPTCRESMMTRARGDSGLDGFLNVCKPAGPTSHDVVALVRRRLSTRRVGHAGTLDPLAEGVLPLALGRATRLVDYLSSADKEYEADIELGLRTTTDDLDGDVVSTRPVDHLSLATIDSVLEQLTGAVDQLPP